MALWGKSFSDIGNIFKSSFGNAFAEVNSKFDLATTKTEKLKASMSGIGNSLKDVFTKTKDSPLELLSDEKATVWIDEFAKATDGGAEAMQKFNKKLEDPSMKAYLAQVDAGGASVQGYTKFVNESNTALKATSLSSKAAAVGMKALSVAMNIGAMLAVSFAIEGLIKLVDFLTVTFKEQLETVSNLKQAYQDAETEVTSLTSQLEENRKKIAEINANPLDIIGKNTLSTLELENAELERQLELQNKISAGSKAQAGKEASKLLNMESQKSKTRQESFSESAVEAFKNGKWLEGIGKAFASLPMDALTYLGVTPFLAGDYVRPMNNTKDQIAEAKGLNTALENLDVTSKTYAKDKEKLDKQIGDNNTALSGNIKLLGEQKSLLDESDPVQKQQIDNITALEDGYLSLETLNPALNSFDEIFNAKATDEQKVKLIELAKQGKLTAEEFKSNYHVLSVLFEAIGIGADGAIAKLSGMENVIATPPDIAPTLESTREATTAVIESTSSLSAALSEQDKNGAMSVETMRKIIDSGYAAALSFDTETNAVVLNKDAYISLANAKIQEQITSLESRRDVISKALEIEKAKALELASAYKITGIAALLSASQASGASAERNALLEAELNAEISGLKNQQKTLGDFTPSGGGGSQSDPLLEAYQKEYAELQHLRNMDLITNQEYYTKLERLNQHYFAGKSKYLEEDRKNLEELHKLQRELFKDTLTDREFEIEQLKRQGATTEQQKELYTQMIADVQREIEAANKYGLDSNSDYIQELTKQWATYQDNLIGVYESVVDAEILLLDSKIKKINEEKDASEKASKAKIDGLDREIDRLKERQKYLDDMTEKYRTAASVAVDAIDEQIKALQDENKAIEDKNKLLEAQEALENAKKQKNVRVYHEDKGWVNFMPNSIVMCWNVEFAAFTSSYIG